MSISKSDNKYNYTVSPTKFENMDDKNNYQDCITSMEAGDGAADDLSALIHLRLVNDDGRSKPDDVAVCRFSKESSIP